VVGRYRIKVRKKAKVQKERADDLEAALTVLEARGREIAEEASVPSEGGILVRRFAPVQQVFGRLELSGPNGLRAGVDVRGDGSVEAFTGRIHRTLVRQENGESAYDALRRVLRGNDGNG
jgi:hypothetical protein